VLVLIVNVKSATATVYQVMAKTFVAKPVPLATRMAMAAVQTLASAKDNLRVF